MLFTSFNSMAILGGSKTTCRRRAEVTPHEERERAQRFRNNVDALELLARQIDGTRDAIEANSPDVLTTFTTAINQQLGLELGRFLEGGDSVRASIAKLGEQIQASRKVGKEKLPEQANNLSKADQGQSSETPSLPRSN